VVVSRGDGLVNREVQSTFPLQVEYSLTPTGEVRRRFESCRRHQCQYRLLVGRWVRDAANMALGTVKFYRQEKGWGAIASPELPDGLDAWVHFSVIEMDGYRSLDEGDQVEFDYEAAQQDSFRFRATRVRRL
jgi:CspA family cold shock protein